MIYFFIMLIVVGTVLELISLRRSTAKISVEFEVSVYSTQPGVPFEIKTVVTNQSLMPISYLAVAQTYPLHAKLPDKIKTLPRTHSVSLKKICRVGGRRKKRISLRSSIDKRGVHIFCADSVEFGDFLGFKEFSERIGIVHEVVVYPSRCEAPELAQALNKFCGDMQARRFLIRDPILTIGTREYTGREPMKEIHWLKSACRGELMVKEFDFNREFSVSVLMSVEGILNQDDSELDGICSTARTVCEALCEKGASVKFFTNALRRNSGRGHLWQCEVTGAYGGALLEGLGRATSLECGSLGELVAFGLRESDPDCAFILIVPSCEERAGGVLQRLSESTRQEVLVLKPEPAPEPVFKL